jgi:hypothetical protein
MRWNQSATALRTAWRQAPSWRFRVAGAPGPDCASETHFGAHPCPQADDIDSIDLGFLTNATVPTCGRGRSGSSLHSPFDDLLGPSSMLSLVELQRRLKRVAALRGRPYYRRWLLPNRQRAESSEVSWSIIPSTLYPPYLGPGLQLRRGPSRRGLRTTAI